RIVNRCLDLSSIRCKFWDGCLRWRADSAWKVISHGWNRHGTAETCRLFQRKRITQPEWVRADYFRLKQFVTSFVCVTVTHGAPFHQRHYHLMLRHASLHTPIQLSISC